MTKTKTMRTPAPLLGSAAGDYPPCPATVRVAGQGFPPGPASLLWFCTGAAGHEGVHAACDEVDRVLAVWHDGDDEA